MILTELVESTRIALEQILASKLRSLLSALGVVIGISVVIIMGWLILALNDVLENTFEMVGVNMLWVSRWDWAGRKSWEEMRNRKQLDYKICKAFKEKMNNAELVTIQAQMWGNNLIKYNNDVFQGINIEGCDYDFQYTSNGEVQFGRYFSNIELNNATNVVVIGSRVNDAIFPDGEDKAVGKTIKIMGRHFKIVGILKKQGTVMMDFVDNKVCIPLKTFLNIYGSNRSFNIGVKASNKESLDDVRLETEGLMRILRNLKPHQENDFSINESKIFEESTKVLRAAVYGVGIGMTGIASYKTIRWRNRFLI
jgi:putative ABC transport system permease protein